MEVITHLNYDHDRHTVVEFLKKHFKPMFMTMVDPNVVSKTVNDSNSTDAISSLITRNWTAMKMAPGNLSGQRVDLRLSGNAWIHVYLLSTGKSKDRMVFMIHGHKKEALYMYIGYVGEESAFKDITKQMNITELEVQLGANHYVGDDEVI